MQQYGETYSFERSRAVFHLDDKEERLRLYVPKKRTDRDFCYCRELPRRLITYLSITDSGAEAVLSQILSSRTVSSLNAILKDAGIGRVEGIECPTVLDDPDEDCVDEISEPARSQGEIQETPIQSNYVIPDGFGPGLPDQSDHDLPDQPNHRLPHQPDHGLLGQSGYGEPTQTYYSTPSRSDSGTPHSYRSAGRSAYSNSTGSGTPYSRAHTPLSSDYSGSSEYMSLVNHVIQSASTPSFPNRGQSAFFHPHSNTASDIGSAYLGTQFYERSFERDKMIGAAGELLVSFQCFGEPCP